MSLRIRAALLTTAVLLVAQTWAIDARFEYESFGLGFDAGFVVPEDVHPTVGWGGVMDFMFNMGDIGKLAIHPNVEMWISGNDYTQYDLTVFEIAFNGNFKYYFPLPSSIAVRPFVGNGIDIISDILNYDWNAPFTGDDSDNHLGSGFEFIGGIDFPFTPSIIGNTEFKAKLGHYDLIKISFGMVFLIKGNRGY